jgi:sialate O-acetylesterase
MVLQQGTSVRIWGESDPGAAIRVSVSWTSEVFLDTALPNGTFVVLVRTPAASDAAQTVTVSSPTDSATLHNVLIGEVFLAAGQSNMAMTFLGRANAGTSGSDVEIGRSARYATIRLVTVGRNASVTPLEYSPGRWQVCGTGTIPEWSAVAFYFAQTLQKTLRVPVGVIVSAWGGARVEGFLPRDILEALGENLTGPFPSDGRRPMVMYNSLIWPVRRYAVRGFLWYQGEANVATFGTYADRLARMVERWRAIWGAGDLPFHYVEIAPRDYLGEGSAPLLREAQFRAQFLIPNSAIVTTNDLVTQLERRQIHPENKRDVGRRLAFITLNRTYGYETISGSSPAYDSFDRINQTILSVFFTNDHLGLSPWDNITGFEVANETRIFRTAKAKLSWRTGRTAVDVWSEDVGTPVAVRYCFKDFQIGGLYNVRHLGAFPFRSDNWTLEAQPAIVRDVISDEL